MQLPYMNEMMRRVVYCVMESLILNLKNGWLTGESQLMEEEGVVFKCNANVGVNINLNDLLREYHAIVLAGGSTVPRDLKYSG